MDYNYATLLHIFLPIICIKTRGVEVHHMLLCRGRLMGARTCRRHLTLIGIC